MSFRYYLYISDSTVDMLLPQIDPAFTRTRTSEVNLSLRIFSTMLPLQWGPFHADPSLVYFGGRTERTIGGLGGSSRHVLGSALEPPHDHLLRYSLTPWLLGGLAADPEIKTVFDAADREREPDSELAERTALQAVQLANARLRGPAQNAEFVAKARPLGSGQARRSDRRGVDRQPPHHHHHGR